MAGLRALLTWVRLQRGKRVRVLRWDDTWGAGRVMGAPWVRYTVLPRSPTQERSDVVSHSTQPLVQVLMDGEREPRPVHLERLAKL